LDSRADDTEVHLAVLSGRVDDSLDLEHVILHRLTPPQKSSGVAGKGGAQLLAMGRLWQLSRQLQALVREVSPQQIHAWSLPAALATSLMSWLGWGFHLKPKPSLLYTESMVWPSLPEGCRYLLAAGQKSFDQIFVTHPNVGQALAKYGVKNRISLSPSPRLAAYHQQGSDQRPAAGLAVDQLRSDLRRRLNLPANAYIAATVAPLIPAARLKDLIWAADLLAVIQEDFHLIICGEGSQDMRLRRFANLTEAGSHVHILDPTQFTAQWLPAIDCYWQSHLLEPLSSTLLQVMSLGLPVIAVYGEGSSEVIRHQQTGLGVRLGGRDEFARWTKYLIEQQAARKQLGEQGRLFVDTQFDPSR